jgi:hypothetical protein
MGATARIILLTLSFGLASGAKAERDINSANNLLPGCKALLQQGGGTSQRGEGTSSLEQGICFGLVSGIAWTIGGGGLTDACADIPEKATGGQLVQVVVRYIGQRPNRLHEPFRQLAAEALVDAWPCRDAKLAPKR